MRSMMVLSIFLECYTCVVATESEGVADGSAHLALLCFVECEVEVVVYLLVVVALGVVDGRGHDAVLH